MGARNLRLGCIIAQFVTSRKSFPILSRLVRHRVTELGLFVAIALEKSARTRFMTRQLLITTQIQLVIVKHFSLIFWWSEVGEGTNLTIFFKN